VKKLPAGFLASLEGIEGFDREAMEAVHADAAQVTSLRFNPLKPVNEVAAQNSFFAKEGAGSVLGEKVPWAQDAYYLQRRPSFTFDPFFHAGCYYVQEASSMFLEQALSQLADLSAPLRVLDLCAAPGGKSTHLQSLITSQSLLVSNEVIRARTNILTDNIVKWGARNTIVTNNDPSVFSSLRGWFDVLLVDAPCSGSGLFRRDADAMDEWSENNVQLCSQRQKRILADALPALKEGGLLVYSTCSYSREEDEAIGGWLIQSFGMEPLSLNMADEWKIVKTSGEAGAKGYRFFPDKIKGEGFFLSCFRKTESESEPRYRTARPDMATAKERAIIQPWLNEDCTLIRDNDVFFALPETLMEDHNQLQSLLRIAYKGVAVGRIMKDRLVPEHALALSSLVSDNISFTELDYTEAIRYLQRGELAISPQQKGWQRVRYAGEYLGWINALGNRVNNYYPKELRILKQSNDTGFEK
jgi:16S rRNA C967 or C1407 C5-methylase (RsmB/RsmF family)/NOL1/NOP2/fmu family ribosome biogenesis protein